MELVHAHQVPFEELLNETIDVLIAACGAESRSSHIITQSHFNSRRKIALLFETETLGDETFAKNEAIFKSNGFECIVMQGDSSDDILTVLDSVCRNGNFGNIKLLVDYSSMSKMWYATIINYFAFNDLEYNNLVVYFCYTPEHFFPNAAKKGKLPKPEPVFFNRPSINENKPVALVVGLGYDESKVNFVCDFFKPKDVYFFLPNPSFDDNYTQMARTNNRTVLSEIRSSNLYSYAAKNIEEIDSKLTSLCLNLRLNFRVVLISLGPKTFSLASFLLNARYPDIEIWNICAYDNKFDLKPDGVPVVYKAILSGE